MHVGLVVCHGLSAEDDGDQRQIVGRLSVLMVTAITARYIV